MSYYFVTLWVHLSGSVILFCNFLPMYGYILQLQVKWVGDKLEETWEPECNVPKRMVDAFQGGEQEPSTYLFGITMVTNLKVKEV